MFMVYADKQSSMMSYQKSNSQSMRIYLKNNQAEF